MSAENDLYVALNVPAVNALLDGGIWPDALPENCAYPAAVFARTATDPINTLGGGHHGDFVTMSTSAWGKTRGEVDLIADAIEEAVRAAGHDVVGREAGFDPDTGLVANTISAIVLAV